VVNFRVLYRNSPGGAEENQQNRVQGKKPFTEILNLRWCMVYVFWATRTVLFMQIIFINIYSRKEKFIPFVYLFHGLFRNALRNYNFHFLFVSKLFSTNLKFLPFPQTVSSRPVPEFGLLASIFYISKYNRNTFKDSCATLLVWS